MTNLKISQIIYIRPAILGMAKSILDSSVTNAEVNINDCSIIRNDRNRNGGGAECYIRRDLYFNIKNISNSIEHVFFKLLVPKVKPIAIGIFYRHPNENDFLICFQTSSRKLTAKPMKFIFLENLISTYSKMENLSPKKISHINLKVLVLP